MCAKSIPWDHAFCARHWSLLPRALQLEVSSTFPRGTKKSRLHIAAMRRAIDYFAHQSDMFLPPPRPEQIPTPEDRGS